MTNEFFKPSPKSLAAPSAGVREQECVEFAQRRTGGRTSICMPSDQLFAGAMEVHIEHRGALYRLQQTSLGKLILTK